MRDKAERNHFYVSFMWHMLAFHGVQVKGKGAYPGFPTRNISTPPWMGCQSIAGLPPELNSPVPIYTPGWREAP